MKDTGGPAFPQCSYNLKGGYDITGGLSLRDYFAAKAMQGMLSAFPNVANKDKRKFAEEMPATAYEYADAMLAERSKG
jgi:hypothetical protein